MGFRMSRWSSDPEVAGGEILALLESMGALMLTGTCLVGSGHEKSQEATSVGLCLG